MKNFRILLCIALLSSLGAAGGARADSAAEVDSQVLSLLQTYCIDCHGPDVQEADFRVDQLRVSATDNDAAYWQLVLDNLNLGEMPS